MKGTDGSLTKSIRIGSGAHTKISSVIETADRGLLLGGWTYDSSVTYNGIELSNLSDSNRTNEQLNNDGFIIKIDNTDTIKSAEIIKGVSFDQVNGIAESDKNIFVVGDYSSSSLSTIDKNIISKENSNNINGFAVKYAESVVEAEAAEVQTLEIHNELLEYNITTEIGLDKNNMRTGGTITGVSNSDYTSYIKYVETVKYGYSNKKDIIVTPDSRHNIKTIIIDGENYNFTSNDDGEVIIPAGFFENVKENHHVAVVFVDKDKSIKIIKTDKDGSRLEGAKFEIQSNNDTPIVGKITANGGSANNYYADKNKEIDCDIELNNNGAEYVEVDKSNELTGVVGEMQNNGTTYIFNNNNGVYMPTNKGVSNSTAYSYFPIDLSGYTGEYVVVVKAKVSSQSSYDIGYATITSTTNNVEYSTSTGRFIYISGTSTSVTTEKEYTSGIRLQGGNTYYLHIGYRKNASTNTGDDLFTVSGINVYGAIVNSYNFTEDNGTYIPNNKNVASTVANSYIPIDLTEKTGKYAIVVNAETNTASNEYLYATVTENTTRPTSSSGSFMNISGNKTAKDYEKILDGGKIYYLHLAYSNRTTSDKTVAINSIKLYESRTYYLEENEGGYESNNQNVNDTYAQSYIPLDLSNYYGRYKITLNAELASTTSDTAYAMLTTTTDVPTNEATNRFFSMSGNQASKNYSLTVEGATKYYIHLSYYNGTTDAANADRLRINSITITPVVETFQAETNADGTAVVELNYYGKYTITETEAPEHYIKSDTVENIEVAPPQKYAEVTFQNAKKPTVTVHHYLKNADGTLTENKVAEDEVTEYNPGDFYVTYFKDDLTALDIQRDENNAIILPVNASGTIGNDDIEVNYYYEAGSIKLTIHHYLDDSEDRLVEDTYEYTSAEVEFIKDGEYIITANGAYNLFNNEDYKNLINNYNLTAVVTNNGEDDINGGETSSELSDDDTEYYNPEEMTIDDILATPFIYHQDAEITYYYKLKTHTITTEVEKHVESRMNEFINQKEDVFVEGGSITGEFNENYKEEDNIKFVEEVGRNENAEQDIIATPNDHYTVKYIKLISTPEGEGPTEKLIYGTIVVKDGENTTTLTAETVEGVTVSAGADGKVTVSALSNVAANKHFIVAFEPLEGTVTIHHIIKNENPDENVEYSSVQISDLVDEPYRTGPIDIEDYRMIESSNNTSGTYTEEDIDVYYYYELDSYEYNIQYYYDGVLDSTKTETGLTAKYSQRITEYPDKAGDYVLDRTVKNPLYVSDDTSKNIMKIYYKSQYNITTEVRKHTELTIDPTSGDEVETQVKGGSITGEDDTPYELVDYNKDAENTSIKATPNDGYIVKSITVVSTDRTGTVTSTNIIYGENAVENPEITCTLDSTDGSVTLENFKNVTENKNVIVEFLPQYKITTSVTPHDETTVNPSTGLLETNSVAGGTISGGTSSTPYEKILLGESNQKQIVVTPDDGYLIATIEINGTELNFKSEAETNDKLTYNATSGTLTFAEGYFTNVREDIDIKASFRKKTKVIVKHYERDGDTFKTQPLASTVEIDGYEGKAYTTSRVEISGYRDAKDQDGNITPSNATGTMTLDTIEVIYYYERIPAGVTVKHLEKVIDSTTNTVVGIPIENVPNESKAGYVNESYSTARQTINKYVSAVPPELPTGSENLIYVAQNVDSTSGTYIEAPVTIVYWYERQFNITTEVKPHDELRTDATDGQKKNISVDGGTISGQNATPYEVVVYNNNSTNEIKAIPNENYIVESIKVVTLDREGNEVDAQIVYGENKAQSPEVTATLDDSDNSVTLANFSNVKNDKKVIVEFKAVQGKVTVHHYINGTTTKVPSNSTGVIDDEEFADYIGEPYTTSASGDISSIYECVSSVGDTSGTFTNTDIEVTYYYDYKYYPYTIEYYYDGVIDNSKTVSGDDVKAKYGTVINSYPTEDKTKVGFEFDHDTGKPLTISDNASLNIIKVYYTSTKVDYLVQKSWNNVTESNAENYESTFTLMKKVGEGDAVPVKNSNGINITGKIVGNGTYKFENLLEYENEVKVTYSVVESSVNVVDSSAVASVNAEYDNSEEYKAIVTNSLAGSFGLSINKTEDVTDGPLGNAKFKISIKDENDNELVQATAEDADKVFTTGNDGALTETISAISIPSAGKTYTVTITEVDKVTGYRQLLGGIEFQATSKLSNDKTKYILTPQTKNVLNTKGVVVAEDLITVNIENEKDLSYTVNYYYDGTISPDDTDIISAKFGDVIESFEDKAITGYKLERVTPAKENVAEADKDKKVELTITDDSLANVINVYYVKDDFEYRVEYYYDGIIDNSETLSGVKATYKSQVSVDAEDVKSKNGKEYKKTEELNNPLEISAVAENNVIKVYYTSQYNISTRVIAEDEEYANKPEGERIVENVKGGSISGDSLSSYEKVLKDGKNTKQIVIAPNNDYEIVFITLNGENFDYKAISAVNNKVLIANNDTVTIDAEYFTDMSEDKHIEVKFRKKSKVIVKYLEEGTKNVLFTTTDGDEFVEYAGYEGKSFVTEHKVIPTYTDSALGITVGEDGTVDDYSRLEIISSGDNGTKVVTGTMYADEITIIYWYAHIESNVVERHIEIDEKGETKELFFDEKNGYVNTTVQINRREFEGLLPVDGPENSNPNVTVASKDDSSIEVAFEEDTQIEVWYYYERQFEITTRVKLHIETDDDGNEIETDGGAIYVKADGGDFVVNPSGNVVENVWNKGDSKTEILIRPEDGYRVKSISINGVKESLDNFVINTDGSITLEEGYFEEVSEDIVMEVEFERIPALVIIKYVDFDTGDEIIPDEVLEGQVDEEYETERKDIEGYVAYSEIVDDPSSETGHAVKIQVPDNAKSTFTEDDITVVYYYTRQFKISTEVIEHYEKEIDEVLELIFGKNYQKQTTAGGKILVKGGTISGDGENPYELVDRGNSNVKEIQIIPDDGYRIKYAKIKQPGVDDERLNVEELQDEDGTITLPAGYFENMQLDKHIIVEFERIPAMLVVNYLEKGTKEVVAKSETAMGYLKAMYKTDGKEIMYYQLLEDEYPQNAEGVLQGDTIVNYWYRKMLFNMEISKKITSVQINGVEKLDDNSDFVKLSIPNRELDSTLITVKYDIKVTNTEEIPGTAYIVEQIPEGFVLSQESSKEWTFTDGKYALTTNELQPQETAEYEVVLEWNTHLKNIGRFKNVAKIVDTENVPGFEESDLVDNEDSCILLIEIKTGANKSTKETNSVIGFVLVGACLVIYIGNRIYFRRKRQ